MGDLLMFPVVGHHLTGVMELTRHLWWAGCGCGMWWVSATESDIHAIHRTHLSAVMPPRDDETDQAAGIDRLRAAAAPLNAYRKGEL